MDTVQERWLVVYKRVRVSGERNCREPSEVCKYTGAIPETDIENIPRRHLQRAGEHSKD